MTAKKSMAAALILIIALFGTLYFDTVYAAAESAGLSYAHVIFVSAAGKEEGDGTKDNPFPSIERAQMAVRELIAANNYGNVLVNVASGTYTGGITFTAEDNMKGYVVSYVAEKGAVISGGIRLDGKKAVPIGADAAAKIVESRQIKNIVEFDLAGTGIVYGEYGNRGYGRGYKASANELFLDDEPMTVAGYPNNGYKELDDDDVESAGAIPADGDYSMSTPVIDCTDRAKNWKTAENLFIEGYFSNGYAYDAIKVDRVVDEFAILSLPHINGVKGGSSAKWRAVNLLEELDAEGEYYIDSAKEKLYFYPPYDIKESKIVISNTSDNLVSFIESENIIFDGFTLECTRGNGAYIEGGNGVNIMNCTFRNLGTLGIQLGVGGSALDEGKYDGKGGYETAPPEKLSGSPGYYHELMYSYPAEDRNAGTNHRIADCDIYNAGAGGVLIGGGDRKSLSAGNNSVSDCRFTAVNRLDKGDRPAIIVDGAGNRVVRNYIYNTDEQAILLRGNDHVIEYNRIDRAMKLSSGKGALTMGGDVSEAGNIIRYNFFSNVVNNQKDGLNSAILFDEYALYNTVYGNYFVGINGGSGAIRHNKGGGTSMANNLYIDCKYGLYSSGAKNDIENYGNSYEIMHGDNVVSSRINVVNNEDKSGVNIASDAYKSKYPYLYDTYANDYDAYLNGVLSYNNYELTFWKLDNMLVDYANGDFTLVADAFKDFKAENVEDRIRGVEGTVLFELIDYSKIADAETILPVDYVIVGDVLYKLRWIFIIVGIVLTAGVIGLIIGVSVYNKKENKKKGVHNGKV